MESVMLALGTSLSGTKATGGSHFRLNDTVTFS